MIVQIDDRSMVKSRIEMIDDRSMIESVIHHELFEPELHELRVIYVRLGSAIDMIACSGDNAHDCLTRTNECL
jgi:hypothetical protein